MEFHYRRGAAEVRASDLVLMQLESRSSLVSSRGGVSMRKVLLNLKTVYIHQRERRYR